LANACAETLPQVWLDAGLDPQPTLAVELGQYVTEGFAPYQDGSWAPIIHGWQGLTHVPGDLRVTVPGASGGVLKSSQVRIGRMDCVVRTGTSPSSHSLVPVGPGQWGSPSEVTLAVFDVGGFESWKLCGRWLDLRVLVRVSDGRWGQQRLRLRLWDTEPTQPKAP
jgi:hypothetical protein